MFTSRAEYRLLLREDNADLRLMDKGYKLGLVTDKTYERLTRKKQTIDHELRRLKKTQVYPQSTVNDKLLQQGSSPLRTVSTLHDLMKRPISVWLTVYKKLGSMWYMVSLDIRRTPR